MKTVRQTMLSDISHCEAECLFETVGLPLVLLEVKLLSYRLILKIKVPKVYFYSGAIERPFLVPQRTFTFFVFLFKTC